MSKIEGKIDTSGEHVEGIDDDLDLLDTYLSGFAAGTIAVKEAFGRVTKLARLGAAVEAKPKGKLSALLFDCRYNNIEVDYSLIAEVDRLENELQRVKAASEAWHRFRAEVGQFMCAISFADILRHMPDLEEPYLRFGEVIKAANEI